MSMCLDISACVIIAWLDAGILEVIMSKFIACAFKEQIATNYGHHRLGEASQTRSLNVSTVATHNLNVGVTTY